VPEQHRSLDWLARRHSGESAALIAVGERGQRSERHRRHEGLRSVPATIAAARPNHGVGRTTPGTREGVGRAATPRRRRIAGRSGWRLRASLRRWHSCRGPGRVRGSVHADRSKCRAGDEGRHEGDQGCGSATPVGW